MKKKFLALALALNGIAQYTSAEEADLLSDKMFWKQTDTLTQQAASNTPPRKRDFTDSKLYQMTFVSTPIIITGLIMRGEDTHFRSLRNDYMKEFHRPFDNYTQYIPAAFMLGMKAWGVKSRSSWSRMIASDAISAAIMASVVQSIKHTTNVMRPDGSDKHSFPSGHTAMAFMTATMLTKEYGHISPWIGVGAYSFASATGLMRIANNKHWMSDVLTGAGIGILSTELGYYLGNLLFKEKGIHNFDTKEIFSKYTPPSFFGIYLGANVPLSYYDIDEKHEMRMSSGSSVGFEGAYFFNPYIGVGGRFTVSNFHIISAYKASSKEGGQEKQSEVAENNTFDAIATMAGPYVSYPITSRWLIGSKLLAGYVAYPKLELEDGMVVPQNSGVCLGSGISVSYKAKEKYGIRFFLDYNLLPSHSKRSGEWMHTLTVGTTFGVHF